MRPNKTLSSRSQSKISKGLQGVKKGIEPAVTGMEIAYTINGKGVTAKNVSNILQKKKTKSHNYSSRSCWRQEADRRKKKKFTLSTTFNFY